MANPKGKFSLNIKIPMVIVLTIVAAISLSSLVIITYIADTGKEEALDYNYELVVTIKQKLDLYLDSAEMVIDSTAKVLTQTEGQLPLQIDEVERILNDYPYFHLIIIMDTEGHLLHTAPEAMETAKSMLYTDRDYYQYIVEHKENYTSKLYDSRALEIPHFVVASPFFDKEGELAGLVAGAIPLENIYNIAVDPTVSGRTRIFDAYGAVIVDSEKTVGQSVKYASDFPMTSQNKEPTTLYHMIENQQDGVALDLSTGDLIYNTLTFTDNGWLIMLGQYEGVLTQQTDTIIRHLFSVVMVTIFLGILVGASVAHPITAPLQSLMEQVRHFQGGELQEIPTQNYPNDEVGELAQVFQQMTCRLQEEMGRLEDSIHRENHLQQYLNTILMHVGIGIVVVDGNGIITIFNHEMEKILGVDHNNYLGEPLSILRSKHQFDGDILMAQCEEQNQYIKDIERVLRGRNQDFFTCSVSLSPVYNLDQQLQSTIFLIRDIEELKNLQQELRRTDRIQIIGKLTASIIHQIGNPLAGIINLTELLQDPEVPQQEKDEIAGMIHSEMQELNELVINYLNFTHKDAKDTQVVSVPELLAETIRMYKREATGKNISIHLESHNPLSIEISRTSLKQLTANILQNAMQAINYGGEIYITLSQHEDMAVLTFKDTGKGIAEEVLPNIFEPFYSTKSKGSGLGLAVVYSIVKENDGTITVDSLVGQGTNFTVTLPIKAKGIAYENTDY